MMVSHQHLRLANEVLSIIYRPSSRSYIVRVWGLTGPCPTLSLNKNVAELEVAFKYFGIFGIPYYVLFEQV